MKFFKRMFFVFLLLSISTTAVNAGVVMEQEQISYSGGGNSNMKLYLRQDTARVDTTRETEKAQ